VLGVYVLSPTLACLDLDLALGVGTANSFPLDPEGVG